LKQVLYNLLTTVLRYTTNGKLDVKVGKLEESQSGATINFQIGSAAGIPVELRRRLFDPSIAFEAPPDSEVATGLDLMIAGHLIRRMNGSIGFENDPDGSSTLCFSVRLDKASDERVVARFSFSDSRQIGARVLLVGAARLQREAAARYLAAWGSCP
jgi:signal transduction histidine kinase